jgi:hypothetical protein
MRKTILFFAICALYVLSIITIVLDLVGVDILLVSKKRNHPSLNSALLITVCAESGF